MVYETVLQDRSVVGYGFAKATQVALLVGFGIVLGMVLSDVKPVGVTLDTTSSAVIAGEDWHGNVRRSDWGR